MWLGLELHIQERAWAYCKDTTRLYKRPKISKSELRRIEKEKVEAAKAAAKQAKLDERAAKELAKKAKLKAKEDAKKAKADAKAAKELAKANKASKRGKKIIYI